MQSLSPDVEAYLAEAPPERRAILTAVRDLCREILAGYEEHMQYGMPTYLRNGVPEFAFASQKRYISLYGMKQDALDPMRDAFSGASIGKGCIRYTRPEQVDLDAVAQLLRATAASNGEVC